jgi:ABC-type branched-subunit amino acid transport system substrate-binding protein
MGPFEPVYRDTKGDVEVTAQAVHELVETEHVVVIIGPVVSSVVNTAASTAAELQVPMIVLSQKADIPFMGHYVFRNFLTPEFQVRTLVEYAMDVQKLKRFGILYPKQPYWMEFAGLFWDEVVSRGGEIVGVTSYPPNSTDFLDVAKRIGRKYYTSLRSWEMDQGTKKMKEAYRKAGKKPPSKKFELPPIVDFDAIFIADQYRTASLIAASLAYTDFPVGGFTIDKKQQAVPLLGTSSWNSPDLLRQGGKFVENCLFVDNFFPESPDPVVQNFVKVFKGARNHPPDIFSAAGYDSINLVTSLLLERPLTRAELLAQLSDLEGFSGATGNIAFDRYGELDKSLFVITVHRKKFRQLVPVIEDPKKK